MDSMTPKEWNEMSPDDKAAYQANLRQRSEAESKTDNAAKPGVASSPSFAALFLYVLTPVPALCLLWTNRILGRGGMEAFGAMATMAFFYIALGGVLLVGMIALGAEDGKGRSLKGPFIAMIIGILPLLLIYSGLIAVGNEPAGALHYDGNHVLIKPGFFETHRLGFLIGFGVVSIFIYIFGRKVGNNRKPPRDSSGY